MDDFGSSGLLDAATQYIVIKKNVKPNSVRETTEALMEEAVAEAIPQKLPEHCMVSDLWRYCRICAFAYETMVPIYDQSGLELQLEEKINNYLPITVTAADTLPLQLCQSCVDKLNVTHDLIVSCLDSNERFLEYLQTDEKNIKLEALTKTETEPVSSSVSDIVDSVEEMGDASKVDKKKVVVLKLVHSSASSVSPAVRIAKALEYLKLKNKENQQTHDSTFEASMVDENSVTFRKAEKGSSKQPSTERGVEKLQVASVAEFCVVTSGGNGSGDMSSQSPKLQSKISKALGTVDNGTKQRIVEAVQHIVSKKKESPGKNLRCLDCETDFKTQGEALNHMCPFKNNKQGQNCDNVCKICNKKFKNAYKLIIHKQTHMNDGVFSCSECGKKFRKKYSLYVHLNLHKEIKPHMCKLCNKRFLHGSSLEVHLSEVHQEAKPWRCDICHKYFASINRMLVHRCPSENLASRSGKCQICLLAFRNNFLLKKHLKTHFVKDTGVLFPCPACPKVFNTWDQLKQHEPVHVGLRPYQCGICSIGFIRRANLTKHYRTHTAEKIIQCKVCKATFSSVAGLLNHKKIHPNEEPEQPKRQATSSESMKPAAVPDSYQCTVCNKFLSSKLSLSLHMRVHTGEKPYECEMCGKRFTQKPALTYHKRLHTGERPHSCKYCGKGFNSKVGKESHERIHTGERPYKCGQCGVGFRCSANLRQHTWIHTDNRPFTCEVCSKLFRRREALQVHMRIHTGERPYGCPICGRTFTQKGDMLKHTRSHSKKNIRLTGMECLHCGQVFSRKVHYRMHIEKCNPSNTKLVIDKRLSPAFVNFKDGVVLKEGGEGYKALTISHDDMITIVTNDVQEYEVEYQDA